MFKQLTIVSVFLLPRELSLLGLLLGLLLTTLSVEVVTQANPSKIKIPFELTQGRIYVDAYVNERGPFRFLVDTGTSGIGLADTSLVKDLGLTVTGKTENFDGVNSSSIVS
jgi:hypothetical protein